MRKITFLLVLCALALPIVTFARQDDGDVGEKRENKMAETARNKGMACGEFRKEVKDDVAQHRETIKENRSSFHENNDGLRQFFETVSKEDKEVIKNLLDDTHSQIETLKKTAYETFRQDGDTAVLDQAHTDIITVRQSTFDTLEQYVDDGEEQAYTDRVATFLTTLTENKDLRTTNAQARQDAREACYDKKSSALVDRLSTKVAKILDKVSTDRQVTVLEKLVAAVEKLIDRTENSESPDARKESRVALFENFLTSIEQYLNDASSIVDDASDSLTEIE